MAATQRIGTRTVTFALALAAFVVSGVSYGKPPAAASLNAAACMDINGVWTPSTCTILKGQSGVAGVGFKIADGVTLEVQGSLIIPLTVTVTNAGTIRVANEGGVVPEDFEHAPDDPTWATGILIYGTLDNSGTIVIDTSYDALTPIRTEGITVSASVALAQPGRENPVVVTPGTLTNSGVITIENSGTNTRGIKNLGIIANSASGTINVANSGGNSVGIYNRRDDLPPAFFDSAQMFYVDGTLTNAGRITISNGGECGPDAYSADPCGYGVYNQGLFTNSAPGKFTINPSPDGDPARGLFNGGSFTNFGTFTNDRGGALEAAPQIWGSFNAAGSMINYGKTYGTGTWLNVLVMINLGTVTNKGTMWDVSVGLDPDEKTMINYGTIYNYGYIHRGKNKGVCINEVWTDSDGTHYGDGC